MQKNDFFSPGEDLDALHGIQRRPIYHEKKIKNRQLRSGGAENYQNNKK